MTWDAVSPVWPHWLPGWRLESLEPGLRSGNAASPIQPVLIRAITSLSAFWTPTCSLTTSLAAGFPPPPLPAEQEHYLRCGCAAMLLALDPGLCPLGFLPHPLSVRLVGLAGRVCRSLFRMLAQAFATRFSMPDLLVMTKPELR